MPICSYILDARTSFLPTCHGSIELWIFPILLVIWQDRGSFKASRKVGHDLGDCLGGARQIEKDDSDQESLDTRGRARSKASGATHAVELDESVS